MQKTVTFLDLSEVYAHLGFTDEMAEHVDRVGFDRVSFGDADLTLVGNNFALDCIVEGVLNYYDSLQDSEGEPSRNIPDKIWTEDELESRYWQLVGQYDYINLEN